PPVVNSSVKTKGFLSTSIDRGIARNFGKAHTHYDGPKDSYGYQGSTSHKHVLRIKIKPGTKHGAYVDHISSYPGEREFILKPGRKLTFKRKMSVRDWGGGEH